MKAWQIVLLALAAVLLLCLLAYPFGYDQAVFAVAGELAIKHGAVTYRDFLDTKPPLIFTIYGVAMYLFGHHEWAPRLLDVLFQGLSLFYFYRVLRKYTADEMLAFGSVLLYVACYTTSGFWMTGQAETFALLPSIWIFSLTESTRTGSRPIRNGLLAGVASAILFLLKFTLLTVPAAAVVYILISGDGVGKKFKLRFTLSMIASFGILMGLTVAYLSWAGAFERCIETIRWLGGYSAIEPLLSSKTFGELFFKQFPQSAVTSLLPTTTILAVIGTYASFTGRAKRSGALHHLLLQLLLALAGVLYERKFFPYHFSRAYWAFVPFVIIGLRIGVARGREYLESIRGMSLAPKALRWLLTAAVVAAAAFYSPLTRVFTNPLYWAQLRLRGGDAAAAADSKFGGLYSKDQENAAQQLKAQLRPNESVFLWGNNVGVYFRLDIAPRTICLTNTPFVTKWTPASWRTALLAQLTASPPRFIVCETEDQRPYITGDTLDSRQHLEQWSDLASFVHSGYRDWGKIGHFVIFEHQ